MSATHFQLNTTGPPPLPTQSTAPRATGPPPLPAILGVPGATTGAVLGGVGVVPHQEANLPYPTPAGSSSNPCFSCTNREQESTSNTQWIVASTGPTGSNAPKNVSPTGATTTTTPGILSLPALPPTMSAMSTDSTQGRPNSASPPPLQEFLSGTGPTPFEELGMMLRSGSSLGGAGGLSTAHSIPNSIPNAVSARSFWSTTSNNFQSLLCPNICPTSASPSPDLLSCFSQPGLIASTAGGGGDASIPGLFEMSAGGASAVVDSSAVPIFQPQPVQAALLMNRCLNNANVSGFATNSAAGMLPPLSMSALLAGGTGAAGSGRPMATDSGLSMENNAAVSNVMITPQNDHALLSQKDEETSKDKEDSNTNVDRITSTGRARTRFGKTVDDGKGNKPSAADLVSRLMSPGEILGMHTPDFPGQPMQVEDPFRGHGGRSSSARRSGTKSGSLRRVRSSQSFECC
ncbi:unnamed protein product [Amoebophrya sp. A25]|nr:unnamed protein product [Amoebophrya sp. A25]|eukprot:GSA25T00003537001.1